MSSFTTPLIVKALENRRWELVEPFDYRTELYAKTRYINVPKGFVTDFASIPQLFWSILPPWGDYGKAAVVHDWLYYIGTYTRREADLIFREAMKVLGVNWFVRGIMYNAVRWFGGGAWKKHRKYS